MIRIGLLILFAPILLLRNGFSQTENSETGWQLPPLQVLIDSALIKSPILKGAGMEVLMSQYLLKDAQRDWMENINFTADARYGSMFDYSRMAENTGSFIPISDNVYSMNYGVGMSAYLPISDIFDRKRKIQKAQLQINQSESRKEEIEQTVKQTVIAAYYEALTSQKTLGMRAEISSSASMLYDQSKLDYAENRITLAEFTKANEVFLTAKNEEETQKYNLLRAVRTLEVIVGIELTK